MNYLPRVVDKEIEELMEIMEVDDSYRREDCIYIVSIGTLKN